MERNIWKENQRFNQLINEIGSIFHEIAVRFRMSDSSLTILYTVGFYGDPCPLTEIYNSMNVSRQTVNSSIRQLEKKGLVYLSKLDGKKKALCLTDLGNEQLNDKILPLIELENSIYASWSEQEMKQYLRLTEDYVNKLGSGIENLCVTEEDQ